MQDTGEKPTALIIDLRESTQLTAFIYASIVAAVTTTCTLEYRDSLKHASKNGPPVLHHMAQTAIVAFITTLFALVILRMCFAYGDSMVAHG